MNYPQEGMIIPRQLAEMISTPPDDAPQEITMAEVEIAQTDPNHVDEMVIVEPRITPNYLVATSDVSPAAVHYNTHTHPT